MSDKVTCFMCGVCCEVLSISSLNKGINTRCKFLSDNNRCLNYDNRPEVCKSFKADEACNFMKDFARDDKLKYYREIYLDK